MSLSKIYSIIFSAVFACCSFGLNTAAVADECHCAHKKLNTEELAHHLVHHFWRAVKHQDVEEYSSLLAIGFQGLNVNGHFNRQDQISGLEGLTITKFKIDDLIASRYGDTLVISYDLLAEGDGIVPGPSIDIWHKKGCSWKQVSHSYVPFSIGAANL